MSKGGPKTVSSLTKGQQGIANLVAEFLAPGVLGEKYSPQAQEMLKNSKLGQGATPYTGELVSPLIPQYNQVANLLSQPSPSRLDNATQGALLNLLSGNVPSAGDQLTPKLTAKYFKENVAKPLYRDFDMNVAPRIKEAFAAGGGSFNSRRAVELANAVGNVNESYGQQLGAAMLNNQQLKAQLDAQAFGQRANAQATGLQLAPTFTNQNLTRALALEQALTPFQARTDSATAAKYQEFLRTAPEANPYLNLAMGFVNSPQLGVYNKPNTGGIIATALGGALLGPMIGGIGEGLAGGIGGLLGGTGFGAGFKKGFGL